MIINDIIVNVNPIDKTDKARILKINVYHPTFKIFILNASSNSTVFLKTHYYSKKDDKISFLLALGYP
jgi:hypothetical protein